MKIYVASSWRNDRQPDVVNKLRYKGHDVYDFKNPPNRSGFAWEQLDPNWERWGADQFIMHLSHPDAKAGFREDMWHLGNADLTVLVMPCGRSAHLELGWAVGRGQRTAVLLSVSRSEPELMWKMADLITTSLYDLARWIDHPHD